MQITHDHHFSGTFNAHLSRCVLIVLNEWSKERAASNKWFPDLFKSAVTEQNGTEHDKFKRAESKRNYWILWLTLNSAEPFDQKGSRRIFEPKVSSHRVGDTKYFSELLHEIENGGKEEFLYYLLHRQLPSGWTPWGNKPISHVNILQSIKNDPKQSFLSFLLTVAEKGCWRTDDGDYLIACDDVNRVKTTVVLHEYRNAMKANPTWRANSDVTQERQLKKLFEKYLPKEFKYKKNDTFSPGDRGSAFTFPSMQQIRKHLEDTVGVRFPSLNTVGKGCTEFRAYKRTRTALKPLINRATVSTPTYAIGEYFLKMTNFFSTRFQKIKSKSKLKLQMSLRGSLPVTLLVHHPQMTQMTHIPKILFPPKKLCLIC